MRGLNETMFAKTAGLWRKGGAVCIVTIFKTSWMVFLVFLQGCGSIPLPRSGVGCTVGFASRESLPSSPVFLNTALHWLSHSRGWVLIFISGIFAVPGPVLAAGSTKMETEQPPP